MDVLPLETRHLPRQAHRVVFRIVLDEPRYSCCVVKGQAPSCFSVLPSFVMTVSALQLGNACAGGSASLGLCREGTGRRPCRQGVSASSSWSEASGDRVDASTCCTLSSARCTCRSSGFQGSATPLHLKKAMQTMVNNFNCGRVQSYIFSSIIMFPSHLPREQGSTHTFAHTIILINMK